VRRSRRPLRIASRRSHLARAQAEAVGQSLGRLHPNVRVEYVWIESEGDRQGDRPLSESGGKGLFVRAVERALLEDRADVAVHSMKDVPAGDDGRPGVALSIAAVPARADVHDCLITPASEADGADRGEPRIEDLPPSPVVGTASPRRAAQLLRLRGDVRIELIRGNIETRLRKVVEDGRFAATLLAAAGLLRVDLHTYASQRIPLDQMLPAAGQGALAVQCRADDHVTLRRCLPLNDPAAAQAVHAERRVVAALHGDCHSAIAVLVEPLQVEHNGRPTAGYRLRARVLSGDGRQMAAYDDQGPARGLSALVSACIEHLEAQGAADLLKRALPDHVAAKA
jgi:hydroxymethylbilane synthase